MKAGSKQGTNWGMASHVSNPLDPEGKKDQKMCIVLNRKYMYIG